MKALEPIVLSTYGCMYVPHPFSTEDSPIDGAHQGCGAMKLVTHSTTHNTLICHRCYQGFAVLPKEIETNRQLGEYMKVILNPPQPLIGATGTLLIPPPPPRIDENC